MEDEVIALNTYSSPSWYGPKVGPVQYTGIVYWRDFLPIPTGTDVPMHLAQYHRRPFYGIVYTYSSFMTPIYKK